MERRNLFADAMTELAGIVETDQARTKLAWAYANEYWLKPDPMHPLAWFAFHHADDFQRRLVHFGAAVRHHDEFSQWPWYLEYRR